jgi:hypothetical protein
LRGGTHWHIGNVAQRLERGGQTWRACAESALSLAKAMRLVGFDPASASRRR